MNLFGILLLVFVSGLVGYMIGWHHGYKEYLDDDFSGE